MLARLTTVPDTEEDIYSARFVSGLFDRMSRSYEVMNLVMSFGFSERWRRELVGLIARPHAAATVVDLMSGMGETWPSVRRTFPNAAVYALDFSPEMIEHARMKNDDRFDGAFTLVADDVLAGGLPAGHFDVVVSAYGLKTFDAAQSHGLAAEVFRILRPGGQFAFIEVTQPSAAALRWLYDFYLSRIVPIVGRMLASDSTEYSMLWRYLRAYGDGARSAAAFDDHPDLVVTRREHFFGCATSFSGYRVAEIS